MLLWFLSSASAVPLIHEGGDSAALIASASDRTGLPASQITAVDVATLREHPAQALGEVVVRRCARQPTQNSAVRAQLVRAEAALRVDDGIAVADHLDLAVAELSCLTEVVESKVAARAFLLRGAMAAEAGRDKDARSEIRTAMALEDTVLWPPSYPTDGQSLMREEAENLFRHPVKVVPDPGLGPWVDGKELTDSVDLTEGLHLLQYVGPRGIRSSWLVVGGPGTVVVPEKFQAPVLNGFVDPATRGDVEQLFVATIEGFEAAYVAHKGGLWLVVADSAGPSTSELAPATPDAPPAPDDKKKKKKKKR